MNGEVDAEFRMVLAGALASMLSQSPAHGPEDIGLQVAGTTPSTALSTALSTGS